jgi:hypothetical protein
MEDKEKENIWRQDEAMSCYERVKPLLSEYFDDWIITGRRAGCGTKVIIGDYSQKKPDMKQLMFNAKKWKANTLADSN